LPWSMLRASPGTTYSAAGATSASASLAGQQTFVFYGDRNKLLSAPSFDQSNWPDISQTSWRQSIYTHFGMTPGSATGAATSPGGYESSRGQSGLGNPGVNPGSSSQSQQGLGNNTTPGLPGSASPGSSSSGNRPGQ
jgi:hypothetical protein